MDEGLENSTSGGNGEDLSTSNLEVLELRSKSQEEPCCSAFSLVALGIVAALAAVAAVVLLRLELLPALTVGGLLGAIAGLILFALTQAEKAKLKRNAQKWKADKDCPDKTRRCRNAIDWVEGSGKFAPAGSDKDFATAMGVPSGSIATAFRLAKLLGLLAQESSFGTNYGSSSKYKGPFQLSQEVVEDYNRHNDSDVTFPDDIDEARDFDTAARVAAWYLAILLQQLTWPSMDPPITDPDEANRFALASYNGGLGTIKKAQKKAKEAGLDSSKWENVKEHLPDGSSTTDEEEKEKIKKKTKEIKDYVDSVREYEKLAKELGCV